MSRPFAEHQPFHCAAPRGSACTSLVSCACRNAVASSPVTARSALRDRSATIVWSRAAASSAAGSPKSATPSASRRAPRLARNESQDDMGGEMEAVRCEIKYSRAGRALVIALSCTTVGLAAALPVALGWRLAAIAWVVLHALRAWKALGAATGASRRARWKRPHGVARRHRARGQHPRPARSWHRGSPSFAGVPPAAGWTAPCCSSRAWPHPGKCGIFG